MTHFAFTVYVTEIVSNMNYGLKLDSFITSRMFLDLTFLINTDINLICRIKLFLNMTEICLHSLSPSFYHTFLPCKACFCSHSFQFYIRTPVFPTWAKMIPTPRKHNPSQFSTSMPPALSCLKADPAS